MVGWQDVATWGWMLVSGVIGWSLKALWDAQKDVTRDFAALEVKLAENYVRKVDLQPILERMERSLRSIEDKLDGKADKV